MRISGSAAQAALEALTPGQLKPKPRAAALRRLYDPATGDLLDEALVRGVWPRDRYIYIYIFFKFIIHWGEGGRRRGGS